MSKVMIDTNVWVDIVLNRPGFAESSRGAVMACLEEGCEVLVAATSLKDIFYFASKSAGSDAGYQAVELLLEVATLAQVDSIVCREAILFERPDYEDGIVAACLLAERADAVISRDARSFNDLAARKFTPDEYLASRGYTATELQAGTLCPAESVPAGKLQGVDSPARLKWDTLDRAKCPRVVQDDIAEYVGNLSRENALYRKPKIEPVW